MEDIRKVIIVAIILATIGTLIAAVGTVVLTYWPIAIVVAALVIGGVVYMKRQKRARNTV